MLKIKIYIYYIYYIYEIRVTTIDRSPIIDEPQKRCSGADYRIIFLYEKKKNCKAISVTVHSM